MSALANDDRYGDWIQTYTGGRFWPMDPRVDEIDIQDIAHALSMQCRYAGHCINFYSVAEHSVHVSRLVPPEHALWGLLHDATEAYLVDVPRPVKPYLLGYKEAEARLHRAIACRFGLPDEIPAEVHDIDVRICHDERAHNMTRTVHEWSLPGSPTNVELRFWAPSLAKAIFLRRFGELTGVRS